MKLNQNEKTMKEKTALHYKKIVSVNTKIKDYFKDISFVKTESINIMRIGEDVILTNGSIENHTDNTMKGKDTVMLIINADGGFVFKHSSNEFLIKSGDILRFNGNINHSLSCDDLNGCFCAIIWDVKKWIGLDDLIFDLGNRLKELNKEIKKKNNS